MQIHLPLTALRDVRATYNPVALRNLPGLWPDVGIMLIYRILITSLESTWMHLISPAWWVISPPRSLPECIHSKLELSRHISCECAATPSAPRYCYCNSSFWLWSNSNCMCQLWQSTSSLLESLAWVGVKSMAEGTLGCCGELWLSGQGTCS